MSELPKFFDSQSQAAAMLKLDSYFLKELKAEGCTAFKPGGRIRRDELVAAIEERRRKRAMRNAQITPNAGEDSAKVRLRSICEVIIALLKARDVGALSEEEFWDVSNPIVNIARDKELQKFWMQKLYDWLQGQFEDIRDARRWVEARRKAETASDFFKAKARKSEPSVKDC